MLVFKKSQKVDFDYDLFLIIDNKYNIFWEFCQLLDKWLLTQNGIFCIENRQTTELPSAAETQDKLKKTILQVVDDNLSFEGILREVGHWQFSAFD